MKPDRPDCPTCGQTMDLGDGVEEPDDGGAKTYYWVCRDFDCPQTKHFHGRPPDGTDQSDDAEDADDDAEDYDLADYDGPTCVLCGDPADNGADPPVCDDCGSDMDYGAGRT